MIIGIFLVRGVVGFGSTYLTEYVGQRIVADLRNDAERPHPASVAVVLQPHADRDDRLARHQRRRTWCACALTDAVASILKDASSLVILIGVAFYQDWVLALIAFVVFPASVLPIIRLSKRLRGFARRGRCRWAT